ncbi:MAG: dienelactone hydrolase family protein [Actinomycetota bacterium]|nr:dienelactone hydrolase family protein [Actinomycetota bacterium]
MFDTTTITIPIGPVGLEGDLIVPDTATGIVVFAHGSGSSRMSPRNRRVADALRASERFGTLLFDLLTSEEDANYETRFNIGLLAGRLEAATEWVRSQEATRDLAVGYFGASTGAAAALVSASTRSDIAVVVSRGGRPDLAGPALRGVTAPTLLIVGGADTQVLGMNRQAMLQMPRTVELQIVPGATHLFEESGALDQVAALARGWFETWMP